MNQKTLQMIYKSHETQQYFRRYLTNLGCREDRRKINERRPIKITARNNSVVISVGQTIIIAHIEVEMQSVTYSPITQSYGEPLLKLKTTSNIFGKHHQTKNDRAVEQYITKQLNWAAIEDQLVGSDLTTGKQYGYKGHINIRILGDDGGAQEYALIAVQLLLWTCKLKKFSINKEAFTYGEEYKLQLRQFLFPFKFCCIIEQTLTDPSLSEQENCQFYVVIIKDVRNVDLPPKVIHYSRKNVGSEELLKKMMELWEPSYLQVHQQFDNIITTLESKQECVIFGQAQK